MAEKTIWQEALEKACIDSKFTLHNDESSALERTKQSGLVSEVDSIVNHYNGYLSRRPVDRYIFVSSNDNFERIVANNLLEAVADVATESRDHSSRIHKLPEFAQDCIMYRLVTLMRNYVEANRIAYHVGKAMMQKGVVPKMPINLPLDYDTDDDITGRTLSTND